MRKLGQQASKPGPASGASVGLPAEGLTPWLAITGATAAGKGTEAGVTDAPRTCTGPRRMIGMRRWCGGRFLDRRDGVIQVAVTKFAGDPLDAF
jgi:hypothetical protein